MGPRSAVDQARDAHAGQPPQRRRPARGRRLSDKPTLMPDARERQRQLEDTWRVPRGLVGWLSANDHRSIGRRYIVTAFVFFVLAGLQAGLMRLQLAMPGNNVLGPDQYN